MVTVVAMTTMMMMMMECSNMKRGFYHNKSPRHLQSHKTQQEKQSLVNFSWRPAESHFKQNLVAFLILPPGHTQSSKPKTFLRNTCVATSPNPQLKTNSSTVLKEYTEHIIDYKQQTLSSTRWLNMGSNTPMATLQYNFKQCLKLVATTYYYTL